MAKRVIYCDVDGVVGDWEGRVLDIYDFKKNLVIREHLKQGGELEDKLGEQREMIASLGSDFWAKIKPFKWANELYSRLNELGDFCFLTSSGNHNKRPLYAAGGAHGKLIWLSENFNGASVSVCRDKYIHAHNGAILIDDNKGNVEKFRNNGGHAFLFPHPYKIEDGQLSFEEVYKQLEKQILNM